MGLIQMSLIGEAIDRGPALIFLADDEMNYVAVNECVAETLGYTRDEVLKMRVTDIVREPTAADEYDDMLLRRSRSGNAILTTKDGRELLFQYRASRTRVGGLDVYVSIGFVDA